VIREKAVRCGRSTPLAGVLSEPVRAAGDAIRPGVLLLNSGILHRVGACRQNVRIARRLAAAGCPVLRFDYSGIGDSEVRRDHLSFEESAVVETVEAMNYLASVSDSREFVLLGLCSGADMAFETAKADARVVGLGLIDPWAYRTPRYYVHHYAPRLLRLQSWKNAIRRQLFQRGAPSAFPSIGDPEIEGLELPTYVREFPPREQASKDLEMLIARDVQMCCVFSDGQEDHYNYQGQFEDAFRGIGIGGHLTEVHVPGSDHIFTDLDHQKLLLDTLARWIEQCWPTRSGDRA
jgi:pimeloyl-ACP methyl ester carboxylesterase